jgi:hypothetical protein
MHIHNPEIENTDSYRRFCSDLTAINKRALLLLSPLFYQKELKDLVVGLPLKPQAVQYSLAFTVSISLPSNGHRITTYGFRLNGDCDITDYCDIGEIRLIRIDELRNRTLTWAEAVLEIHAKIQTILDFAIRAPRLIKEFSEELTVVPADSPLPTTSVEPSHAHPHSNTGQSELHPSLV